MPNPLDGSVCPSPELRRAAKDNLSQRAEDAEEAGDRGKMEE